MLRSLLDAAAGMEPERVVLKEDGRPVTLAELQHRSDALARHLAESGADACALLVTNGPVLPITLLACATAGIPAVPLNFRLPDADLQDLLGRFERPLTVVDERQRGRVESAFETTEWLELSRGNAEPFAILPTPETTAVVLFTSGTTSAPKAVALTHANFATYILNTLDLCGADPTEATLVSVPPYHVAGVGSALSSVLAGRRVAYLPAFTARGWLDVVAGEKVTSAMVVPTMLARIVEELGDEVLAGSHLRQLSYGGAPVSPAVLRKALDAFPDTGFVNAYGLTETSSTLALLSPEDHRTARTSNDPAVAARLGSVGRPVPGVEVQVRDDDGTVLGADEPGVLWVRGEQVSGSYVGLATALDADGWFCTRDGVRIDRDGYLYIIGRVDDTIIRGGENIAPAEIERVLADHDSVRDVGVVGVPDDEWGQRIVAAVIPSSAQFDAHELMAWARPRLRSSRTPDNVVVLNELPYGPTGKLLRRVLLDQIIEPDFDNEERTAS